ncbi:MAG: hypothetical protein ABJB69_05365 [Spartobacteria bacterium]
MLGPRSTRSEIIGAFGAGFIVVFFCFILLARDPLLFWNDDYELSVLPVFADVARSWNEGHLPLLSPYSWVCSNLAGEFQYGTFSSFINAVVVLVWKLPLTFPQQAAALSITHLFVLAAGAFLLARGRAFNIPLSIFVALVATLNGWIICWGAIDWLGALTAFAWLPWAWWALERAQGRQSDGLVPGRDGQCNRWRFIWPAPFVYLLVTGGFPYTVVMFALLLAWLSIKSLVQTKSFMSILPMLGGTALGFGLAAPALLALLDYVHGSGRGVTSSSAHWQWIVPLSALPGFILPCWTVNWADFSTRMVPHSASEMACGLVAPVAFIAAIVHRGRAFLRQVRWDFFLLLLVLLLCLLPSAGVFRWSFRWLPFLHLILALCAAETLRTNERRGFVALLLVGVTTITMSILRTNGEYGFPLAWIFLALAAIWTLADFFLRDSQFRYWIPAAITFAAFLATYLCIPPNCGVPKYNLAQALTSPVPLDPQRLYLSIYPPAEHTYRTTKKSEPIGQVARPGSTSMWAGLRFINGYSPILASGVAREFGFAIHGEIDPGVGSYLIYDESGALAELGVDGMIVAQELTDDPPQSEWQLAFANDEARVFHRRGAPFERVRSTSWIDSRPAQEFATANISGIKDSRNQVELDVDVPAGDRSALLRFSRPFFRGYIARLGQQKLAVDSYRGFFPVVEVPAGARGHVVLAYRPAWLIIGGGLSILCAAIFLAGLVAAATTNQYTSRL